MTTKGMSDVEHPLCICRPFLSVYKGVKSGETIVREIIHVANVSFSYSEKQVPVLKNINFSVNKGEWLAVLGHNGSGKSTLAKLLNGLLLPSEGKVTAFGYDTREKEHLYKLRQKIGFVWQNPDNQIVAATVRADIAFGLENLGVLREQMVKKIAESAHLVGISHLLDEEASRLSGGQKQRLAIAGVLACEPEVIIFDEATSMLDPHGKKEIIKTMQQLKEKRDITIISITHDLKEAALADRIIVLHEGRVVRMGTPAEIFQHGDELYNIGLDMPFPVQVYEQLKERGIVLENFCLTNRELVEEIWKLL